MTCVLIRFAPKHLKGVAGLTLEIKHSQTGHVLKRFQLELLDEVRTQLLRLEGVQPQSRRLWVYNGNQRYEADIVVQSNESVRPELTIPASGISGFLPEFKTNATWHLLAGRREFLLEQKTIILGNEAVTIKANSLSLKDQQLFPAPGQYQLLCCVACIEVARFCFRIIDRSKWLQGLKVQQVCLHAETVSERSELERGALIWKKHIAFTPRLELAAPAPAPNETVACRTALRHRGTILQSHKFFVQFDQATKYIVLKHFSLQKLDGSTQGKHLRLELEVYLENDYHGTWPIIVVPYNRISNFEGQLTSNAREFAVDIDAYRDILNRLGERPISSGESLPAHKGILYRRR
jgi:hypothetical protein